MADTSKIKEHMDVIGSDGEKIGQVDRVDGSGQIKLTKNSAPDGAHHLVQAAWIDHVDSHVHLNKPASDVKAAWKKVA